MIYGMSSFPLTNSVIFQDGEIAPATTNQSALRHEVGHFFQPTRGCFAGLKRKGGQSHQPMSVDVSWC